MGLFFQKHLLKYLMVCNTIECFICTQIISQTVLIVLRVYLLLWSHHFLYLRLFMGPKIIPTTGNELLLRTLMDPLLAAINTIRIEPTALTYIV